jgi:high affinity sulfate transporter 1
MATDAHQHPQENQSGRNADHASHAIRQLLSSLSRYIPIVRWLPRYQRSWLRSDVIAGVTLVALAVPESLGYAQIAGLPVEFGLYAVLGALVGYALFGPSRQLVAGPSAALAALSAATVGVLAPSGSSKFIVLSAGLALMAGVIALVAGLLRLGFVAQFLAEPVLTGFIFGLALSIAMRQAPKLFGVKSSDGNFFQRLWGLLTNLGSTNGWTLVIGILSLAILFGLKYLTHGIPEALIAIVFGLLAVSIFGLEQHGVAIVGAIPQGLPHFGLPQWSLSDIGTLISGALGLTLVGYAEHFGAASSFAARHHDEINANQELIGMGMANIGSSVCQGFAVGGSLSKTAANDGAGARSQISGLMAALLVILTLLVLTPLFHNLPEATLGAIVIFAVWGLLDVGALRRYARLRRLDFVLALTALFGELIFDVLPGLLIAVILSLLLLIYRASRPHVAVLGRIADIGLPQGKDTPLKSATDRGAATAFAERSGAYADIILHPAYTTIPGALILRVDAPLFFANATTVRTSIRELIRQQQPAPQLVLMDIEATSELDTSSADMLAELAAEVNTAGAHLALARVRTPVRAMLDRSGALKAIGEQHLYPSVEQGVADFLARGTTGDTAISSVQAPMSSGTES